MQIVVPLAGPDFEQPEGCVKAEIEIDGIPLLLRTLDARAWRRGPRNSGSNITFVLRDTAATRRFAEGPLRAWYPEAERVFLSSCARGAALSALAGVALASATDEPLCIDLVDIEYLSTFDPARAFGQEKKVGGVALVFCSNNPAYSYLRIDDNGTVAEAAEKRVISDKASAGTYFFASPVVYLAALAHNLRNASEVTYNDLFYVCPVFNGVLANGLNVILEQVENVRDEKSGRFALNKEPQEID